MKNIVWLASYPKSGNTWVRTLLTSLIKGEENSDNIINSLLAPIVSSREIIDEHLLLETSELTQDETDNYFPLAIREFSASIPQAPFFMKTHTAYVHNCKGEPIYPADISIGAIYIARNILDVIVSYAHHNNDSIDNTIANATNAGYILLNREDDIKGQLKQPLLSWERHISGWKEQADMPVLFIRYEDMLQDALGIFRKIVRFSGLQASDEEIKKAVNRSAFDKLQAKKQKEGFKERKGRATAFFRKGKTGSWRESLTDAQAGRIIENHKDMMLQLGYIDAGGNPLY